MLVVFGLMAAAALAIKLPELFGLEFVGMRPGATCATSACSSFRSRRATSSGSAESAPVPGGWLALPSPAPLLAGSPRPTGYAAFSHSGKAQADRTSRRLWFLRFGMSGSAERDDSGRGRLGVPPVRHQRDDLGRQAEFIEDADHLGHPEVQVSVEIRASRPAAKRTSSAGLWCARFPRIRSSTYRLALRTRRRPSGQSSTSFARAFIDIRRDLCVSSRTRRCLREEPEIFSALAGRIACRKSRLGSPHGRFHLLLPPSSPWTGSLHTAYRGVRFFLGSIHMNCPP